MAVRRAATAVAVGPRVRPPRGHWIAAAIVGPRAARRGARGTCGVRATAPPWGLGPPAEGLGPDTAAAVEPGGRGGKREQGARGRRTKHH